MAVVLRPYTVLQPKLLEYSKHIRGFTEDELMAKHGKKHKPKKMKPKQKKKKKK